MHHFAIWTALLIFLLPFAHAQEHDGIRFSIEGDLQHFDYREYNDQGKLLDRESGFLPGLLLGMDSARGPWRIAGELSYHAGNITYNGQTNGGEPIATTTQQQVVEAELHAEYQFQAMRYIHPTMYFGAKNHWWRRNIQPTYTAFGTPVRGLLETYRWYQIFLGTKISTYKNSFFDWALDARLTRIISPKIDVDFFGLYDKAQLVPEERWGFRLAFPMSYSINTSTTILLETYLEKFELGRSPLVSLTNQGVYQGTVFEPDSFTSIYGVSLGIQMFY